jgi:hypothetical protein
MGFPPADLGAHSREGTLNTLLLHAPKRTGIAWLIMIGRALTEPIAFNADVRVEVPGRAMVALPSFRYR